jgi:hypothetical protein
MMQGRSLSDLAAQGLPCASCIYTAIDVIVVAVVVVVVIVVAAAAAAAAAVVVVGVVAVDDDDAASFFLLFEVTSFISVICQQFCPSFMSKIGL